MGGTPGRKGLLLGICGVSSGEQRRVFQAEKPVFSGMEVGRWGDAEGNSGVVGLSHKGHHRLKGRVSD